MASSNAKAFQAGNLATGVYVDRKPLASQVHWSAMRTGNAIFFKKRSYNMKSRVMETAVLRFGNAASTQPLSCRLTEQLAAMTRSR
jgi:uncharacterized protein YqjF (DUF2071 family)